MKKIWIDYPRALGIIVLVIGHSAALYYREFGHIQIYSWWFADILSSFSRFAVPIFVMISGCVLLGRDLGIKEFYTKRASRLIPPFMFWFIFYLIFRYVTENHSIFNLIIGCLIIGRSYYHLWYLPMLMCLMVFVPFINKYIMGEKPTIEDFFYLFAAFAILMTLNQISSIGREVFDASMGWFKSFPWFIGYLLMGYFVDIYSDKIPIGNTLTILIILLLSIFGCLLNYYSASQLDIVSDDFIFDHTGIHNFIRTIFIFYLFAKNRHIFTKNSLVSSLAKMSFGIYLIHPFFLKLLVTHTGSYIDNKIIELLLLSILVFILSYLSIFMLSKIKWFKVFC